MGNSEFRRADIGKLESFVSQSEEAIQEFSNIIDEFDRINNTLLKNWEGEAKAAYGKMAVHITEKIKGIKEILDTINDKMLKDIIEQYNTLDKDLGEQNRQAGNSNQKG